MPISSVRGNKGFRINEERQFTNPHVRFVRIRGRIVPIVNKKRIGQDVSSLGYGIAKAGAIGVGIGLAKKTAIGKSVSAFSKKAITKIQNSFNDDSFKFMGKSKLGLKRKALAKISKASISFSKGMFSSGGKIGVALLGIGTITKLAGDEIQMRSEFGKDYFFTKDRSGRGS